MKRKQTHARAAPASVFCARVGSNLAVDPANSRLLVSKIKPCLSQHKRIHGETADGSLKQP